MVDSAASEQSARMTAMDNASSNAGAFPWNAGKDELTGKWLVYASVPVCLRLRWRLSYHRVNLYDHQAPIAAPIVTPCFAVQDGGPCDLPQSLPWFQTT